MNDRECEAWNPYGIADVPYFCTYNNNRTREYMDKLRKSMDSVDLKIAFMMKEASIQYRLNQIKPSY